jgi:hypothetical protein
MQVQLNHRHHELVFFADFFQLLLLAFLERLFNSEILVTFYAEKQILRVLALYCNCKIVIVVILTVLNLLSLIGFLNIKSMDLVVVVKSEVFVR